MYVRARNRWLGAVQYVPAAASTAETIISGIVRVFSGIFGSSSFPDKKARIDSWVRAISCDPGLTLPLTRQRWAWLRCGSGDNSVWNDYIRAGADPGTQGFCGFETRHGSRAYAQAAVQGLLQAFPSLATNPNANPALLVAYQPEGDPSLVIGCTAVDTPAGTIEPSDGGPLPYPAPGGVTIGGSASFSWPVLFLIGGGLWYAATRRPS